MIPVSYRLYAQPEHDQWENILQYLGLPEVSTVWEVLPLTVAQVIKHQVADPLESKIKL